MVEFSEADAIRVCQSDQDQGHRAFRSLYNRYLPMVRSYASRLVRSMSLDEVVQETFVRLYKSRHGLDPDRPLKPYLLKIAHNAALDELRLIKKNSVFNEQDHDSLEGRDNSQRTDLKEAMDLALERLAPLHRAVLLLKHEQKLTFAEIAAVLDCSESTARNRLMTSVILFERALRKLGVFEEGDKS